MNINIYIARVEDNRDPDQRGRVKLSIPEIGLIDDQITDWVDFMNFSGVNANTGEFRVPDIGTQVFVWEVYSKDLDFNRKFYYICGFFTGKPDGVELDENTICFYKGKGVWKIDNEKIIFSWDTDSYIQIDGTQIELNCKGMKLVLDSSVVTIGVGDDYAMKYGQGSSVYNPHTHTVVVPGIPGSPFTSSPPLVLMTDACKASKLKVE